MFKTRQVQQAERLNWLYDRYVSDRCSEDELQELMTYFGVGSHETELRTLIQQEFNKDQGVMLKSSDARVRAVYEALSASLKGNRKTASYPKPVKKLFQLTVAACLFGLIALGISRFLIRPRIDGQVEGKSAVVVGQVPDKNRAYLKLADGSTVLLDNVNTGVLRRGKDITIEQTRSGVVTYKSEAGGVTGVAYNELQTPKGGQYTIVLDDGSKVWLNAASRLKFPTSFSKNEREVILDGEAYFEITADKSRPFKVLTAKGAVQVLGTSFNINAYSEEPHVVATILTGKVKIISSDLISTAILKGGQQATISPENVESQKNVDVDVAIAWKQGFFHFNNMELAEVMREISRWYDIEISYQDPSKKLAHRHFTGYISREVTLPQVMEMLSETGGLKVSINQKKVMLMP